MFKDLKLDNAKYAHNAICAIRQCQMCKQCHLCDQTMPKMQTMPFVRSDNANACKIICVSEPMANEHEIAMPFVLVRQCQIWNEDDCS